MSSQLQSFGVQELDWEDESVDEFVASDSVFVTLEKGQSVRIRIIDKEKPLRLVSTHWVQSELIGTDADVPILCLGEECMKIILPNGQPLHIGARVDGQDDPQQQYAFRCFSYDHRALRFFMHSSKVILRRLKTIKETVGDLRTVDLQIKCSSKGPRRTDRVYEVDIVPNSEQEIVPYMELIKSQLPDMAFDKFTQFQLPTVKAIKEKLGLESDEGQSREGGSKNGEEPLDPFAGLQLKK